jgi:hypothetical protein
MPAAKRPEFIRVCGNLELLVGDFLQLLHDFIEVEAGSLLALGVAKGLLRFGDFKDRPINDTRDCRTKDWGNPEQP